MLIIIFLGVDFKIETIQVNGVVLQITIWDTGKF
jgi:hypothetical protein